MKKHLIIIFIYCFTCISTYSQIKLKTYPKKTERGFEFLADNEEYCPVSVKVDFTLNNMSSSNGNNKVFVVPARTKGFVISKLKMIKSGKYSYRSKTRYNYGNHLKVSNDTNYVYKLPFAKEKSFKISQGYYGARTHQNEKALDFSMPIGTDIYAARGGVVIKVVDKNTKTCYKKECMKYNNLILIYHKDGTFATYVHIDTNSAKVKVGDKIEKGQLIAKSGNIGWSSGPHLHFVVFNQKIGKRETLSTKFKVNEEGEPVFLKDEGVYLINY